MNGLLKVELDGSVNVGPSEVASNIKANIRRPLPQARPHQIQGTRVAIVAGGPSLRDTLGELRDLVFEGAKVVAVNGAYAYLIANNIKPSMQVVIDARPFNARFVEPAIPGCRYFLASQCAPVTFDACEGRDVHVFHCIGSDEEEDLLKGWYGGSYHLIGGGTTVTLRAILLLRMLGFIRMDIFGMDSCWLDDQHHAYEQSENNRDRAIKVWLVPKDPKTGKEMFEERKCFYCDPWHMKQAEEFQAIVASVGDSFMLNVHGDGMIAGLLRMGARLSRIVQEPS
jgi:hypothetical protein